MSIDFYKKHQIEKLGVFLKSQKAKNTKPVEVSAPGSGGQIRVGQMSVERKIEK